jgi:hypothetical protein
VQGKLQDLASQVGHMMAARGMRALQQQEQQLQAVRVTNLGVVVLFKAQAISWVTSEHWQCWRQRQDTHGRNCLFPLVCCLIWQSGVSSAVRCQDF